jgi:hypothetical protein
MIPVYQRFVDKDKGDCMQAAVAALFELPYDEVPKFIESKDPNHDYFQLALDKGYDVLGSLYNNSESKTIQRLQTEEHIIGIKGLFLAAVRSPKYYEKFYTSHAVLVDKNYNIVFDPNPEYKDLTKYPGADKLGYNGILYVFMINEK